MFGIPRRRVASFEEPVKKLGAKHGRIDLFWKGVLLVEQKSAGRDLEAAKAQALEYFPNLKNEELPRYILVSDFQRFELYDPHPLCVLYKTAPQRHLCATQRGSENWVELAPPGASLAWWEFGDLTRTPAPSLE